MASRSGRRVSVAAPPDSGVTAESPQPVAATHEYDPRLQPAAYGHGHSATIATKVTARLPMSQKQTRTKRLAIYQRSRAATAGRSKVIPWKVLQHPRPPTASRPSLPRASPVCTPHDPISHSSPPNCPQESKMRSASARGAYWHPRTKGSRPLRRLRSSTRSQTSCLLSLRTPSLPLRQRRSRSRRAKRGFACSRGSWPKGPHPGGDHPRER